jgi:hypothetical protein
MESTAVRDAAIFGSYVHAGGAYGTVEFLRDHFGVSRPTIGKIIRLGMSVFDRKPGRPAGPGGSRDARDEEIARLRRENAALQEANQRLEREKKAIQLAIEYLDSLERDEHP